MKSRTVLFVMIVTMFVGSICPAQETKDSPVIQSGNGTEDSQLPAVPYIAEVTGTDVYVRSGHSTSYYYCSKINAPERVVVVNHKYGWSKIMPPPGSFSWISKSYVKIDESNQGYGVVTGDSVRVWAGASHIEPMHSHSQQTKLNEGDVVTLMGKESGDYYKIVPPSGAHLWVSSRYLNYVGPLPKPAIMIPAPAVEEATTPDTESLAPATGAVETVIEARPLVASDEVPVPAVVVKKIPTETERLAEYHDLVKQMDTERAKPIAQQSYGQIKEKLNIIASDAISGKAGEYAKYQLHRIASIELAISATAEIDRQESELAKLRQRIKDDQNAKLEGITDPGKFTATGKFRKSHIYTSGSQKRYLLINDSGKIVCYAVPGANLAKRDMSEFLHHKVGITGKVKTDTQSPTVLIEFSNIVDLK